MRTLHVKFNTDIGDPIIECILRLSKSISVVPGPWNSPVSVNTDR